jgi:ribonuclease HI
MLAASPHYLLYTEVSISAGSPPRWRFVLQSIGAGSFLTAEEAEADTNGERLELLAVVRGLEALEEPSRVTLVTTSRYVNRGIRRSLIQWRERHWRWERFGQSVPIRNLDLWQRVDRALEFHRIECSPAHWAEGASSPVAEELESKTDQPAVDTPTVGKVSPSCGLQWRFDEPELNAGGRGPFFRTLDRLRQGILAPLAAIWRPAFTRAA